eukprot:391015-Prorocentrum_minimum.AAC.1
MRFGLRDHLLTERGEDTQRVSGSLPSAIGSRSRRLRCASSSAITCSKVGARTVEGDWLPLQ